MYHYRTLHHCLALRLLVQCKSSYLTLGLRHSGSVCERINPHHFLTGCCKRRLNQALSCPVSQHRCLECFAVTVLIKCLAGKTPPRTPFCVKEIISTKPRLKTFFGLVYYFIVLLCFSCHPVAQFRLFVLKMPLNTNKPTNLGLLKQRLGVFGVIKIYQQGIVRLKLHDVCRCPLPMILLAEEGCSTIVEVSFCWNCFCCTLYIIKEFCKCFILHTHLHPFLHTSPSHPHSISSRVNCTVNCKGGCSSHSPSP